MRFMMIVKASKDSEAGKMPTEEMIAAMGKYNEELIKAGVLVDLAGLKSSANGARVRFSGGELIAGFWIINVKSLQEAIDWAKRVPPPHGPDQVCELEIRPFFELEDFAPSDAVEHHKELGKKLAAGKK